MRAALEAPIIFQDYNLKKKGCAVFIHFHGFQYCTQERFIHNISYCKIWPGSSQGSTAARFHVPCSLDKVPVRLEMVES